MRERLFWLRKTELKLSREKFGERVGMSASEVRNVEDGATQLKENKIPLICREFSINETWLRTGQGEPYTLEAVERQTAEYLGHAISHNVTSKDAFLRAIAAADDETIAAVIEFMRMCVAELEKQK